VRVESGRVRWLLALLLVLLPVIAGAKPKVAIAPLDGDDDDAVAHAIEDEAEAVAKVTPKKEVARAIKSLDVDTGDKKGLRKLRTYLEVDAVINGKVEKAGSKHRASITITGRGKKKATFDVTFKKASDKAFRKELAKQLKAQIEDAAGGDDRDDEDDDDRQRADEDRKRREREDEDRRRREDDDRKQRERDDDDRKRREHDDDRRHRDDDDRRHRDDDDDSSSRVRRKRRHRDDDTEVVRHPTTQANLLADAGALGGRRTLTWAQTGAMGPPRVGTASFAATLEAEAYPAALGGTRGPAANVGVFGSFGKTLGLSIAVPGATVTAPINEGHYELGARYRFMFGTTSVAAGVSYWRRFFKADRSGLGAATLDMPDVDYSAIAAGGIARFAATPTIGVFAGAELPLMLSSGPITTAKQDGYGAASILAFALDAGVDVALAPHYGVHLAAAFDQIGLSFNGKQGSGAQRRGVSGATDRTIALVATFELIY
jgi:hypothetical protein